MKPSFIDIFMGLAYNLSRRSHCSRNSVGAVVTSTDYTRVYGIGYNGNVKGGSNSCDSSEVGNCGCLHAEENALLSVSEPPEVNKMMFVTVMPCKMCAKRIVNKGGFTKIYYWNDYRSEESIEIFKKAKIKLIKIELIEERFVRDR